MSNELAGAEGRAPHVRGSHAGTGPGVLADALRGAMAWQHGGWPGLVQALENAPAQVDPNGLALDGMDDVAGAAVAVDVGYRARRDNLTSGITRFVDGTQQTVVLGSTVTDDGQITPVVYFLGGAAVMGRDTDTRIPFTVALDRFDGLLLPKGAQVPAGVPASAVQRLPADAVADLGRCIDLVRARRAALEISLTNATLADPSFTGWLLVDGDLSELPADPRLVGVVKRVNLNVAPAPVVRAVLGLTSGQRTGAFTATYGPAPRTTWFLRLRPASVGDPSIGVVRVEMTPRPVGESDRLVDEVSRWLLAERGRPGADVHNPILMVEIVEARLRAALPERAWLGKLFPRR